MLENMFIIVLYRNPIYWLEKIANIVLQSTREKARKSRKFGNSAKKIRFFRSYQWKTIAKCNEIFGVIYSFRLLYLLITSAK